MAGPKHPRHHDEAFKRQIVQSCESGKPSREIRAGHDIARFDPAAPGPGHPRQRLRPGRGQPHARAERAGRAGEAQQAVGDGGGRFRTSGAGIRTKAGVIRANAARYPISARCGILGVPRSTCYWMTGHPEAERADPIAGDVRAVRRDGRERYGARKIKAALERRGVTASRRRIGDIMREQGMTGAYARGRSEPHRTRADEAGLANLPRPAGSTATPRARIWRATLTYVRVGGRLGVRVSAGRPGGQGHRRPFRRTRPGTAEPGHWARSPRSTSRLADVQVFHTDRGGEFDNTRIDEPLDVFGIRRSLSCKGNPYDNAVVESTNRLLKKELVYRNHYTTTRAAEASDLNDYVWWSDNQRLHSTLGYRSPKEFTEQGLVL